MRKIKAQKISLENFNNYGSFCDLLNPNGPKMGEGEVLFYRDQLSYFTGGMMTGFSTVLCQKRPMIIDEAERHMDAVEALIPLNDDIVIFAARAGDDNFPIDEVEAFIVPKGYIVTFKAGVWHKAQFPLTQDKVSVACILPERTYARDCLVVKLDEPIAIEI